MVNYVPSVPRGAAAPSHGSLRLPSAARPHHPISFAALANAPLQLQAHQSVPSLLNSFTHLDVLAFLNGELRTRQLGFLHSPVLLLILRVSYTCSWELYIENALTTQLGLMDFTFLHRSSFFHCNLQNLSPLFTQICVFQIIIPETPPIKLLCLLQLLY